MSFGQISDSRKRLLHLTSWALENFIKSFTISARLKATANCKAVTCVHLITNTFDLSHTIIGADGMEHATSDSGAEDITHQTCYDVSTSKFHSIV
jgi:hypothetical protein